MIHATLRGLATLSGLTRDQVELLPPAERACEATLPSGAVALTVRAARALRRGDRIELPTCERCLVLMDEALEKGL